MSLRQILHMDVVPHAGAVRRGIVLAEDADVIPLTQGCFHHQRDQVGFGVVISPMPASVSEPAALK